MNALNWFAAQPLVERLGWTLVHSLWQGALIAALLAVALCVSREADARLRYFLACAALICFTLCPLFTFAFISGAMPARDVSQGRTVAAQRFTIDTALAAPLPDRDVL